MIAAAVQSFRAIVLLLLLCNSAAIVFAQADQYKFRRIDVDRGLSHNRIQTFFKDKSGFLWIGTYSGLNRFDGYTIRVFRNDPRDSSSLPDDNILRLYEIPDGRMGVLTYSGLSIYDPTLERFDNQLDKFYKKYEIPDGTVRDILRDRNNNYWIVHSTAGLVLCTNTSQIIHYNRNASGALRISSDSVVSVTQDPSGDYWLIHSNGVVDHLSRNKNRIEVIERITTWEEKTRREGFKNRVLAASDGRIWVLMSGRGVYCFDPLTKEVIHLHKDARDKKLNTNIVSQIAEDNSGRIWVSTDHGGVNIVDPHDFSVSYVVNREEDEKSLSQNSITEMYKDSDGIIWLGTFKKGVSYYHESIIRFPLYTHYPLSTNGLPYADVNRFVEDDLGNLWIGTNGGGLIYFNRNDNTFKQYKHNPSDPNSLSSDVIVSLCIDHAKKLWIGTFYGGLNVFDGKKFIRYNHDPKDPTTVAAQNIWEIFEDSGKRLWIGTLEGGLDLLDRRTGQFLHYKKEDINSVRTDYIAAIHEDNEGNIWIGTDRGVDVLSRERGRFVHYETDKGVAGSLSNNSVLDIHQDKAGRIWIGTQAGLNLFDPKTRTFRIFTESDGLPHNTILTILDDAFSNLWLGTPNGLSQAIVSEADGQMQLSFKNYDDDDGLQGKQFNENAALRTSKGELIFGGANGFNIFIPSQLPTNNVAPPVVLSDFYLFNRSIRPGEIVNGINILPASITQLKKIELPAEQNDFSIELSAINYFHPEKNKYKYKLEGFHEDWIAADPGSRKVTLTNIDPGTYVFRAKASNNDGVWNEEGVALKIVVLPPAYKSKFAFAAYFFLVIGALFLIRKIVQFREKIKFQHEQERQESIRLHELDMMKLKFFTNVSHEFRTPLTLILTPLEKLLKHPSDGEQEKQFQLIQRNAKRLLNLVNQLLDFRKLEVQEIKLRPSEGDIIRFIRETVFSFSDLSEKKDIKLEFRCGIEGLETMFDQDKLEKILFNLLSNAFKFTPEHGAVTVEVQLNEGEQKTITIKVIDTGIGIPPDKQEKIFERFFQTDLPKSVVNQGSGIGLSITKEFVRVHGGTIAVESQLEKGSTFIVTLPVVSIVKSASPEPEVVSEESAHEHHTFANGEHLGNLKNGASILLVEDNEDFRFYLKDNLKQEYTIFEARDGAEGWNQTLGHLPDLIISDVMMPQMNGIELCKRVKTDPRSSHIPVILLTARTAEEQKIEGYESGADEYVTKPFNFEILQSRIHNLIALREKFHKSFPKHFDVKASELKITSLDEKLIQNAIKCVEDNVSNADFSVEDLSRELGISRAHFYKKIMALTGKSPLEFIRTIRLQRAAQLLEKSQLTVAEIAYEVGFNSPKYFARYFKEEYHMLPSAYAASHKRGDGN